MLSTPHCFPEIEKTQSSRRRARPRSTRTDRALQPSFDFDRPNQHDEALTRLGNPVTNAGHCEATHIEVNGLDNRSGLGMDATPSLGIVRSYSDLVAVIRARMIELDVTLATVDHIAGLPTNYASKLLGPNPAKRLGIMSFEAVLGAVGLKLIAIEDDEALARVRHRLVKRRKRLPLQARPSASA